MVMGQVSWNNNLNNTSAITCVLVFAVVVGSLLFLNNTHIDKIAFAVGI